MSPRMTALGLVWLAACGAGCEDSGAVSQSGGSGGNQMGFDASPGSTAGGAGGVGGLGGAGTSSASAGVGGMIGPSAGAGNPQATCADESPPPPGDDKCLACIVEQCCDSASAFHCIRGTPTWWADGGLNPCYSIEFRGVRDCFARELAAGSTEESWYIVANCMLERQAGYPEPDVVAPQDPRLPGNNETGLVECVVGPRPASFAADAGVLDGGLSDDDGGSTGGRGPQYRPPHCADECFEGWR